MRWPPFILAFCFGAWFLGSHGTAQASKAVTIDLVIEVDLPQAEQDWDWHNPDIDRVKAALATAMRKVLAPRYRFWDFAPQPTDSDYRIILKIVSPDTLGIKLVLEGNYAGELFLLGTNPVIASDEAVTRGAIPANLVIERARGVFEHGMMTDAATRQLVRRFVHAVPVGRRSAWMERSQPLNMKIAVELPSDKLDLLRTRRFLVQCSEAIAGGGVIGGHVLHALGAVTTTQWRFDEKKPPVEALIVVARQYKSPTGRAVLIDSSNLARVGKLRPGPVLLLVAADPTPSILIAATIADADQ